MVDKDLANELRERLLAERARIEQEVANLAGGIDASTFQDDETDAADQHPADDASELFEREKNMTVLATLQASLQEITDALRKFDQGTYGICETCGKPIAEKRLQALPEATHCIECQARLEREAQHRAAH
jgi:DnaK suppressor protein